MNTTTVLVADPQPFFCHALAVALGEEPGLGLVGSATTEPRAMELAMAGAPQVILAEVEPAGGFGLSLARRLAGQARVVALTREHEGDILYDAVEAGVWGVVSHHTGVSQLASMARDAASGSFAIDRMRTRDALGRAIHRIGQGSGGGSNLTRLTPREREILGHLARGLDDRTIARMLVLSPNTVRTHVRRILTKLEVHSRAEAGRLDLLEELHRGPERILHLQGPRLLDPPGGGRG